MTSSRRRVLVIALPIVTLVGALSVWLYNTEWVDLRANEGYTVDAMLNPFLGAGLFLERLQVEIESSPGLQLLDALPPVSHALLTASSWRTLSPRRVEALIEWVEHGGHLIMQGTTPWNAQRESSGDPLLDFLQVQVHERPELSDELAASTDTQRAREELTEMAQANINANTLCGPVEDLVELRFSEDDDGVVALFSSYRSLVDAGERAFAAASNGHGTQVLQFEVGDGTITVMTTLRLWRNRRVECHDHAHVLRMLVGTRQKLWWLYDTELPALPILIWRNAALVVLGTLALIGLITWRAGFRFGPPLAREAQDRRQLMEHIDAVARFYWQYRSSDELLDELREEVMHVHRVGADQNSNDLAASLGALTGVAEADVRWALSVKIHHKDVSFVRAVSILQKLRKAI